MNRQMSGDFTNIARWYDPLSRLVFGKAQIRAQEAFIPFLPETGRVLLAGGGSGWILEAIAAQRPSGLEIVYVEASSGMLRLARKRNSGMNRVWFVAASVEDYTSREGRFDVVITPFLFDLFAPEQARQAFLQLDEQLQPEGRWLFTDFVVTSESPRWQQGLLTSMYLFFRVTAGLRTTKLYDMSDLWAGRFEKEWEQPFYGKFIRTAVYRKSRHL